MKRLALIAITIALAWPTAAYPQCSGQFIVGQVCGNAGSAQAPPAANLLPPLLDANFGAPSQQGAMLNRGVTAWGATSTPILGLTGTTNGTLGLTNIAGGIATLAAPPVATNSQFVLPNNTGAAGFVLTTDGTGRTQWANPTSGGTVTSVGLTMPTAVFAVTGSPVTVTGTLAVTLQSQAANSVFAGPTSGAPAAPAFRALTPTDLPLPTTSTIGGVQAVNQVTSNWINSINSSGVPQLSQPTYADISGNISQIPGTLSPSQLPSIANNTILSNTSGGTTFPVGNTLTALIDSSFGNVQGDVLYRSATGWTVLAPGSSGQVLQTQGASANPQWFTVTGTGTVSSVATNNGLTGGPVTTTGTIGLATIATGNVLAYTGGGTGVPVATAPTAILDVIGSAQGDILYRGASNWFVLAPGTSGQFLQTQGAAATPQYASITSNLTAGTGIAITGTTTATIANTAVRDYIAGLGLFNDAVTPNSVIDIGAGIATDNTNVQVISLASSFTGSTAGPWVAGSGQNKMGQGLTFTAATWYHVCLTWNGGATDFWIDTSAACANRPSSISSANGLFRRIGSIRADGSAHIYAFTQTGDEFLWKQPATLTTGAATSTSSALVTLLVPSGVEVFAKIQAGINFAAAQNAGLISAPDAGYTAVNQGGTVFYNLNGPTSVSNIGMIEVPPVRTNIFSQVSIVFISTAGTYDVTTYGWIDQRGKNN